ncbi:MAG: hypothetical protein M1823_006653, partial [Watsoniomyces obsoletus]
MPSRRPFTARGKRLGRFKILVAGQKGSGRTSLIKSIVQVCEDIVHVDPLSPTPLTPSATSGSPTRPTPQSPQAPVTEIYASTKPYPPWWSDVEESRILRRRKSMGDSVLERNLCFVDTLDNVDALGIHSGHQFDLLGGLADENMERVKRQNRRKISVIIGNPPYNANQQNENDNNKNRAYKRIDERIAQTFIKRSSAQKKSSFMI